MLAVIRKRAIPSGREVLERPVERFAHADFHGVEAFFSEDGFDRKRRGVAWLCLLMIGNGENIFQRHAVDAAEPYRQGRAGELLAALDSGEVAHIGTNQAGDLHQG